MHLRVVQELSAKSIQRNRSEPLQALVAQRFRSNPHGGVALLCLQYLLANRLRGLVQLEEVICVA